MTFLTQSEGQAEADARVAHGRAVEKTISDYRELVEALQAIAERVIRLRIEAADDGYHGVRYVPRASDFSINLDSSRLVEASYYYKQNDHYFNFPLSYAWQPDFEDRERAAITERAAKVEADKRLRAEQENARIEAHQRALYHQLRAKYGEAGQ